MIIQDLKYAFRLLSNKPGFTALTTLVMAVGIGISIYMFSFFNTILFKDLPFKDSESLMLIVGSENGIKETNRINMLDYQEIKKSINGLSEFGSYMNQDVNVTGRDGARRYIAIVAEENIFELTRVEPLMGRGFTSQETNKGAELVVVIGYKLWQNLLGGTPDVIDNMLQVNGKNHRIVGVMPQGYLFPNTADLWLPLQQDIQNLTRANASQVRGLAHLSDGYTKQDINAQLSVIMKRIEQRYPETNTGIGAYIATVPGSGSGGGEAVVYTMHIVAVLILILASINVSNLLLSRAIERGKETAIRVALGAPRSRLISQMLWESIIICVFGGIVGLLVVAWGLEITNSITASFFPTAAPFWWHLGLDAYTIKLFLAIVFTTIIVTGLLPAWKNSGGDFNAVLRDGTRGALGKKSGRLNRILVISEIFISMTVLIAAAVMVVSAYQQSHADIGADTNNILTANIVLPDSDYATSAQKAQFAKTLKAQLANSTQIDGVILASALPGDYSAKKTIAIEGQEYSANNNNSYPTTNYIASMPGSLSQLNVSLKQGRYLNNSDDGLEKNTAVVSDIFAEKYFPGTSAIGKRFRLAEEENQTWITIVGVVGNTIQGSRREVKLPTVYRPYTQSPTSSLRIGLKMNATQKRVTSALRSALKTIDPQLPSFHIATYEDSNKRFTAPIQFISSLVAIFGIAAVILAGSGIYGVMSNTISQRTQEIGIKRALGADESRITKEFLLTGVKQLLWGGVPGILAGAGMGMAMSQVFGTTQTVVTVVTVIMASLVASIVLVATYSPTQKALKLEPSAALHYE